MTRRLLASALLLLLVWTPPPSRGETVVVVGADGADGTNGSEPGADGESAFARADSPGEINSATATGGDGGRGGIDGPLDPRAAGGRGGDAVAEAEGSDAQRVEAFATSGSGGDVGGSGGSATAKASLVTNSESIVTGVANASARDGYSEPSGDAFATLAIENQGTGAIFANDFEGARATADSGGDARAEISAVGGGDVHIRSEAWGGYPELPRPGIEGYAGGDASASATGTSSGTGDVTVEARAVARDLGDQSGSTRAEAFGSSAGGGDVFVEAFRSSAGDEVMRDAVGGSTSGRLVLEQNIWGRSPVTSLNASNPGGGDLVVDVTARGSGRGSSSGPRAGTATVETVTAEAAGSVDVQVFAGGGDAHRETNLVGDAHVLEVFGRSTGGGPVSVRAHASGGGASEDGSIGGDASLVNVVSAETSGSIVLEQIAEGGEVGFLVEDATAGDGRSRLDVDLTSEFLEVRSTARGHTAEASSEATNRAGGVQVDVVSEGTDASSAATARTFGDDHAVSVGTSGTPSARGFDASSQSTGVAQGDAAVNVYDHALGVIDRDTGLSGTVSSSASGVNAGTSTVTVRAIAEGGSSIIGDDGGDAGTVTASGSSTGGGTVLVTAESRGGDGGSSSSRTGALAGEGGDARIQDTVTGSSAGRVRLELLAIGGDAGSAASDAPGADGGDAHVAIDQENPGGGDLEIFVRAESGNGRGTDGRAGSVSFGPVIGRSHQGGDVSVEAFGWTGFDSSSTGFEMIDVVDGETTGNLALRQEARGQGAIRSELGKRTRAETLSVESVAGWSSVNDSGTAIAMAGNDDGGASASAIATGSDATTARAEADGTGDGSVEAISRANGGVYRADATAIHEGAGPVVARASGVGSGGTGVHAYGSNAGSGRVVVSAAANDAQIGWSPDVTAEGHSSGGGEVVVSADVSHLAGSIEMIDAVSGSTSGQLALRQNATGSSLAPGGEIVMGLGATNPGGGDLAASVEALSAPSHDVVLRDVTATSATGAEVALSVNAAGGRIRREKVDADGSTTPSRIFAASNGGAVSVSTRFSLTGVTAENPSGHSIDLFNVADASTSGALSLSQTAVGGNGGSANASGGNARSVLDRADSLELLRLEARAEGGSALSFGASPANNGIAEAVTRATNDAGAVEAFGVAVGGSGGGSGSDGGAARVEVTAVTQGDGNAVTIGAAASQRPNARSDPGAFGGIGASSSTGEAGNGADARSTSTGTAHGNSTVAVFDLAVGGAGGRLFSGPPEAHSGAGGTAFSEAVARGAGPSAVTAKADARGGAAGINYASQSAAGGGDAEARAVATGAGLVEAWGRAEGGGRLLGFSGPSEAGGAGRARASADGATGFARAEAITGTGSSLPRIRAESQASVDSRRDTAATALYGAMLAESAPDPDLDGLAFLTGAPVQSDASAALASHPAAAARFAQAPGSHWIALGRWQGTARENAPLSLETELEIVLAEDADPLTELALAAFRIEVSGEAFEGLGFAIERNGVTVETASFDSVDQVLAFFAGGAIDLGADLEGGDSFLARFQLELGSATTFAMDVGFAQIVPEPSTGVLMVFGLVLLSRRRRRH